MRLSTKGRYAVTAMLDLALHENKSPVTLADISQCERISLSYLEQLFARLRRAVLVEGIRGPGGGYRLKRPSTEISVAEIITAVDEKVDLMGCSGQENCKEGEKCITHQLWCDLSKQIREFLTGITLGDLVNKPEVLRNAAEIDAAGGRSQAVRKAA
jgi:Rrf2 family iron-sulfur cluster assembly transcriptional regulator